MKDLIEGDGAGDSQKYSDGATMHGIQKVSTGGYQSLRSEAIPSLRVNLALGAIPVQGETSLENHVELEDRGGGGERSVLANAGTTAVAHAYKEVLVR